MAGFVRRLEKLVATPEQRRCDLGYITVQPQAYILSLVVRWKWKFMANLSQKSGKSDCQTRVRQTIVSLTSLRQNRLQSFIKCSRSSMIFLHSPSNAVTKLRALYLCNNRTVRVAIDREYGTKSRFQISQQISTRISNIRFMEPSFDYL